MQLSPPVRSSRQGTQRTDAGGTAVQRRQARVCDAADATWKHELAVRHWDRELDAEHTESVFAAEVRPWLVELERKRGAQKGTRLVDRKWKDTTKLQNREYIASIRRKHRDREELVKLRDEAKSVFLQDLRRTQRVWLKQLGNGIRRRNLPDIALMTPAAFKDFLLEATAAMRGKLTNSVGGRRMHIIAAMREAEIDIESLPWRTSLMFCRLPELAELSEYIGEPEKLFAKDGLLTSCPLKIAFKDGRKPITIASLSDARNVALIPGKFPPPRPKRSTSADALSAAAPTAVTFSQSEPELRHSSLISSGSSVTPTRDNNSAGSLESVDSPSGDRRAGLPAIDFSPGSPSVGGAASHSAAEAAARRQQRTAQVLAHLLDLANSREMAKGHLTRNWFRTYLAPKAAGRCDAFAILP
jgi:hypothetical protein